LILITLKPFLVSRLLNSVPTNPLLPVIPILRTKFVSSSVIGFFFPVVAKGKARIRVQLSAAHEKEHLDKAIEAFIKVGKSMEVI
jgi:hypothetical protein